MGRCGRAGAGTLRESPEGLRCFAMSETAIELALDLSVFASGPVSGSTWDTLIRIDGTEHRFNGGEVHRVPCAPGTHAVEVEFAAAELQLIAKAMGYRAGLEKISVDVAEGQTAKLIYKGGVFWKYGSHELVRVG